MTELHGNWILGGGIASGKSSVRRLFETMGVPVIDADSIGHMVLQPDGPAFAAVAARWPQVIQNGAIDRGRLGGIVFSTPEELAVLEEITHPHIADEIRTQAKKTESGVVVELPLLRMSIESDWCLVVVDSRDDTRLRRAVKRGLDEPDVRNRMETQPSRAEWLAAADAVIPNHGSVDELRSAAMLLLAEIAAE